MNHFAIKFEPPKNGGIHKLGISILFLRGLTWSLYGHDYLAKAWGRKGFRTPIRVSCPPLHIKPIKFSPRWKFTNLKWFNFKLSCGSLFMCYKQLVSVLHKVKNHKEFLPMTNITYGRNAFGII